ncbi:MAG: hypothetical protein JWO69_1913 [Thermoleophilia bacterium]|nr:hypothetical protein [Thermoleophilia bacterium]
MLLIAIVPPMALLAWAAQRARRARAAGREGTRPHCGRCGYDITGIDSTGPCPECGSSMAKPGATTIGRPVADRAALGRAIVVALLAVGFAATASPSLIRRLDFRATLPTFVLRWEMARGDGLAARELSRRQAYGSLWFGQLGAAARSALEAQSNPNVTWSREMGNLVEAARAAGDLSDEEWRRYARHAPQPYLKVRPIVRAGDRVPIEFWLGPSRLDGSESQIQNARGGSRFDSPRDAGWPKGERWFYLRHRAVSVRVAGGPEQAIDDNTVRYSGRAPLPTGGNQHWTNDWPVGFTIPADAPTGATFAEVNYDFSVEQADTRTVGEIKANPLPEPILASWRETFRVPITIVARDAETVTLVADPATDAAVRAAVEFLEHRDEVKLAPKRSLIGNAPNAESVSFQMRVNKTPVPVAFEVIVRTMDGREVAAGTIVSDGRGRAFGLGQHSSLFWGTSGATVDVILRASPAVARQTPDLDRIWGGEICYSRVPLYWARKPYKSSAGIPATFPTTTR